MRIPVSLKAACSIDAGISVPKPKLKNDTSMAREVLPERAGLVVVLGQHGRARPGHVAPARGAAEEARLDPRPRVHLDPLVRIDAHDPAVARVRLVRVAVEVVADGEPVRERLMVRRDVHRREHARTVLADHPPLHAQLRDRGIAMHARALPVDLVERPVFLHDEDDVPDRPAIEKRHQRTRGLRVGRHLARDVRIARRPARCRRRASAASGTSISCSVPCMMSPGCAPRGGSTNPRPPLGPDPSPLALLTSSVRSPGASAAIDANHPAGM